MPDGNLYRQVALDRLASPERLDGLMRVTDAKGWLGLVGCGVVLSSVLVWAVFGGVPTKQAASGILIYRSGLADVVSVAAGQVASIDVEAGDLVQKDQVIARVEQPGLVAELAALNAQRLELQRALDKSSVLVRDDLQLRAATAAKARAALHASIGATGQRAAELGERLDAQRRLYDKGLVTKETLLTTQDALRTTQTSLNSLSTELQQVELTRATAARSDEAERRQNEARLQDNARQTQLLRDRLEQSSRVTSAYDGRVVEVGALVGDLLAPGQSVASIERTGRATELEALLYFDSRQNERVKPGMRVELSPSSARRERFGVLEARVLSVEAFPSTRRGMLRVLHNEQLVDALLSELRGAPIAVRAKLEVDRSTDSGYAWSSQRGARVSLASGMRCTGAIITGAERPISLLFPVMESLL